MPKPQVIFVLGGPGSGKGTQCKLLKEKYNFGHMSVGQILRQFLKSGGAEAKRISQLMKEGKMAPSQPVVDGLKKKLLKEGQGKITMVDGFPRNQDNIDAWNKMVGHEIEVILLLYIEVRDDVMRERLLNRGKTSGRLDDTPEVIAKRLVTFHKDTEPVLYHYKHLYQEGKTKVLNINGELSLENAQKRASKFLLHHHIV